MKLFAVVANQSFVKAVADAFRTHLCVRSSDWELDDESARHLLNFKGTVLNSKTLEWTHWVVALLARTPDSDHGEV